MTLYRRLDRLEEALASARRDGLCPGCGLERDRTVFISSYREPPASHTCPKCADTRRTIRIVRTVVQPEPGAEFRYTSADPDAWRDGERDDYAGGGDDGGALVAR